MSTINQTAPATSSSAKITDEARRKYIRITGHGKMKQWIANSLAFLEVRCMYIQHFLLRKIIPILFLQSSDEDKTLIFHTLPSEIDPQITLREESGKRITQKAASTSTDLIPRLISVVEIIKREYVKNLETKHSIRMAGLHQYNEIGCLQKLGVLVTPAEGAIEETAEVTRSRTIIQALEGKNHPRQTQTPFMRITLSLTEQPELIENGATYQPPIKRNMSKSAKMRAKKRVKKAKAAAAAAEVDNVDMAVDCTPQDKDAGQ
ncbi:hypothetical protein JR316_0011577 [Psilocybe cubensis]|uniref:Uncharacterized protein n=2 Tax=Psilocybe cubensis TaxID=181762 RepID=A0A8H7XUT6_PSICU|nr:hypothetical protein JR316_0011577 [Psilocybe cubensis]KAH9476009.1 hypothetical protein JR316_0011577 [Psilocybe cubensis]